MSNSPTRGGYLKLKELTNVKILKLREFGHKILIFLSIETLYEVPIKIAFNKLLTIIGIANLDFHQCFCSKRLFYLKRHLKRNYYICCLKKIIRVDFSRHGLPKSKIGLPNLDFNEFFCGKGLIPVA